MILCLLQPKESQLVVPQVLFWKATFQLGGPQIQLVLGVVPPKVQGSALPFAEIHEVPSSPFLQPVPLDS